MGYAFFDTSALVKRYADELGAPVIDALIEDEESTVLIASLSVIETVSAFRREQNRHEISGNAVDGLLSAFFHEALADFRIIPMEEALFEYSFDLVLEDDLRTLGSLQLSAALSVHDDIEALSLSAPTPSWFRWPMLRASVRRIRPPIRRSRSGGVYRRIIRRRFEPVFPVILPARTRRDRRSRTPTPVRPCRAASGPSRSSPP